LCLKCGSGFHTLLHGVPHTCPHLVHHQKTTLPLAVITSTFVLPQRSHGGGADGCASSLSAIRFEQAKYRPVIGCRPSTDGMDESAKRVGVFLLCASRATHGRRQHSATETRPCRPVERFECGRAPVSDNQDRHVGRVRRQVYWALSREGRIVQPRLPDRKVTATNSVF